MAAKRYSVCALDCPDACGLVLDVEGERATKLRGNSEHPVTQGFLCSKVAKYLDREYSPNRLLYPRRRVGPKGSGTFERITWDTALDEIASRLSALSADFGPEALLPYSYGGSMGLLQANGMDRRFFHRFGASRLDRTICASAGTAGLMATQGVRYGVEPEQFVNSKFILAWGANILATNVHLWPFIVEARRRGAKFYVIDPWKNRTAGLADRHYQVNPGSDLALALGMLHVIFAERLEDAAYLDQHATGAATLREKVKEYTPAKVAAWTGLPAAEIVSLAREYAAATPSTIRLNYGLQRSERGGSAVKAIAMLPVVTGAWRHAGGGLQLSTSQAFAFDRPSLEMPELQQRSPLGREARLVNMSELGAALTRLSDPPVKGLLVYCSNPAAVAPNQNAVIAGLQREDLFTVVIEQFQTDTADHADIVLPCTTFLEHTDIYGAYGHYYMQLARPALPAPGETKSNVEIFRLLAQRLGFSDACFEETEDEMIVKLLASGHKHLEGITLERLDREHFVRLNIDTPYLPFAEGNFGHENGKANLDAAALDYTPPIESRHGTVTRYPLEMISPKLECAMNSTFSNRDAVDRATSILEIHSLDAEARGIENGDRVRVFNDRGATYLRAMVDGKVAAGVVAAPSVRAMKRSEGGRGVNALTSERLTDIGGGATFYSCLVQVEKCGD